MVKVTEEEGQSLSVKVRNGYIPTDTDVKVDIYEWQSDGLESVKREGDLSVRRGVSSRRSREGDGVSFASVTCPLLYKKAVGHLPRELSFSISLYLSAYLPTPYSLHSFPYVSQLPYSSPNPPPPPCLPLSATVKSDRLQVCFHCEGGFTAAVCLQPLSMTQHLSQFTVP